MINKLNELFKARYSKRIEDMNKAIYKAAKDDSGCFEVPSLDIKDGGFTEVLGKSEAFSLSMPARAGIVNKKLKALTCVYRVALAFSEAEVAANKPEYFNYLFDGIVDKAFAKYQARYGDADKVRFGEFFIKVDPLRLLVIEGSSTTDDQVELRIIGSFASDVEG